VFLPVPDLPFHSSSLEISSLHASLRFGFS
jgi:hypothetical protein